MTLDATKTIEEKIRKDGSLSEERKTELLRLVAAMKPEMKQSLRSQKYAKGMIRSSDYSKNESMPQKKKYKDS